MLNCGGSGIIGKPPLPYWREIGGATYVADCEEPWGRIAAAEGTIGAAGGGSTKGAWLGCACEAGLNTIGPETGGAGGNV